MIYMKKHFLKYIYKTKKKREKRFALMSIDKMHNGLIAKLQI